MQFTLTFGWNVRRLTSLASVMATPPFKYKAFISYSHFEDKEFAPELQRGLHRFAKPWFQLRAIRVFRDQSSMELTDDLWSTIEEALSESEYLILLASPKAAQSKWVELEVDYFLENRGSKSILLVLTSGEITWDSNVEDFDWGRTVSLPSNFAGKFHKEPLFIDFRDLKKEQYSTRSPEFLDHTATISSKLRAIDKDEIIGMDVTEHRRTKKLALGAITTLIILTLLTIAAAIWANFERQRAEIAEGDAIEARDDAVLAEKDAKEQRDLSSGRLSTSHFNQAVESFRKGRDSIGLAYLSSALDANPSNVIAGTLLANALWQRHWATPNQIDDLNLDEEISEFKLSNNGKYFVIRLGESRFLIFNSETLTLRKELDYAALAKALSQEILEPGSEENILVQLRIDSISDSGQHLVLRGGEYFPGCLRTSAPAWLPEFAAEMALSPDEKHLATLTSIASRDGNEKLDAEIQIIRLLDDVVVGKAQIEAFVGTGATFAGPFWINPTTVVSCSVSTATKRVGNSEYNLHELTDLGLRSLPLPEWEYLARAGEGWIENLVPSPDYSELLVVIQNGGEQTGFILESSRLVPPDSSDFEGPSDPFLAFDWIAGDSFTPIVDAGSPLRGVFVGRGGDFFHCINDEYGSSEVIHRSPHSNVLSAGYFKKGRWLYAIFSDGTIRFWDKYSLKAALAPIHLDDDIVGLLEGQAQFRLLAKDGKLYSFKGKSKLIAPPPSTEPNEGENQESLQPFASSERTPNRERIVIRLPTGAQQAELNPWPIHRRFPTDGILYFGTLFDLGPHAIGLFQPETADGNAMIRRFDTPFAVQWYDRGTFNPVSLPITFSHFDNDEFFSEFHVRATENEHKVEIAGRQLEILTAKQEDGAVLQKAGRYFSGLKFDQNGLPVPMNQKERNPNGKF